MRTDRLVWYGAAVAVLTVAAHIACWLVGGYGAIPFVDVPLHAAGGFAVGLLAMAWLRRRSDDALLQLVALLGLVQAAAIAWECFEWGFDRAVGTGWQNTIADTLKDLLVGTGGGAMAWGLVACRRRAWQLDDG